MNHELPAAFEIPLKKGENLPIVLQRPPALYPRARRGSAPGHSTHQASHPIIPQGTASALSRRPVFLYHLPSSNHFL